MTVDPAGNLYAAVVGADCFQDTIAKYDSTGALQGDIGSGLGCANDVARAAASGTLYLADGCPPAPYGILKFDADGKAAGSVAIPHCTSSNDTSGCASTLDLSPDNCRIYYTTGGSDVDWVDTCSGTLGSYQGIAKFPCTDPACHGFTPAGSAGFVRVMPDGDLLVTDTNPDVQVFRVHNGVVVARYAFDHKFDGAGLSLDPDGHSFWVTDGTGHAYRVDMVTGRVTANLSYPDAFAIEVVGDPSPGHGALPLVVANPATRVVDTTATVNGTIEPPLLPSHVGPTTYYFEYGIDDFSHSSPGQAASSGSTPEMVSADLGGLQPNTAYQYRLVVTTTDGTFRSDPLSLTTLGPPVAATGGVSGVAGTTATLLGTVDPDGPGTMANFEYGPATAGGGFGGFSASTSAQSVGGGREPIKVSAGLTGLVPGETYYYRLDAGNQYGSTTGATESFKAAALPPSAAAPQVCSANAGPPFVLTKAPPGSGSLGDHERAALADYAAQLRKTISELKSHRTGPPSERSKFTLTIDEVKAELKEVARALTQGHAASVAPRELPRAQLTQEETDLLKRAGCGLLDEYRDSLKAYVEEHGTKNTQGALKLIGKLGDLGTALGATDASDSEKQKLLDDNIVELFGKFGMGVGGKKGEEIATLIGTLETDFHGAVNASSLRAYKRTILAAAKKIAGKDGQTLADKLFTLYDLLKGNLSDDQKWALLKDSIVNLADYLAGTEVLNIPQVRAATLGFELGRPFGDAIARDLKLIAEKKLAEECLTAIAQKQESEGIPTLGILVNVDFGTATEATIQRGVFKHDWFCRILPDSVAAGVKGAVLEVERAPSVFEVKGFRWEWGHEKFYFDTFFSGVQTSK